MIEWGTPNFGSMQGINQILGRLYSVRVEVKTLSAAYEKIGARLDESTGSSFMIRAWFDFSNESAGASFLSDEGTPCGMHPDGNRSECRKHLAAFAKNLLKNLFIYQISAPRVPRMGHLYVWQLWEHCRFLGSGTWLLVCAATSRRSSMSAARRSFSRHVDHHYRHTWFCRTEW